MANPKPQGLMHGEALHPNEIQVVRRGSTGVLLLAPAYYVLEAEAARLGYAHQAALTEQLIRQRNASSVGRAVA
jgi:hypothetical protein